VVLSQVALAVVILAACSFAPGFYFVRRLAWSGLEKLCGSIALSLTLLWLAAWGVYVLAPGAEGVAYPLISVLCLAMGAAAWRDGTALLRGPYVRRALAGYGFLMLWALVLLSIIRNYSGANWSGDWLEHFQRTLFFLHHFPLNIEIYGHYTLAARPPAMNVLAAFMLAQTGDRFEVFQVVFAFLNLLLFLPCVMALPVLARPRRPGIVTLMGMFAVSPVIMQNATYTWTKSLPVFFVIVAILFYLKAWQCGDIRRMVFAFVALTMGLLAHYSAGPYIAFFALHYLLFVFWKRKAKWKELVLIAGWSGALLGTWFAWSIAVYGTRTTVASNTSVTGSQQFGGSNLKKIVGNLVDSTIPPLLHHRHILNAFMQPNPWGRVRDQAFIIYQLNLIFCMGALGGFAAWGLALTTLRKRRGRSGERMFWIGLIVWSVVVGIAVVGERDRFGAAHLTLLPMATLGMTLVASRFAASRTLAWAVLVGCVIDFSMGVLLQARMQHLENTPERLVFPGLVFGSPVSDRVSKDSLSPIAWDNWMHKHEYRLAEDWGHSVDEFNADDPSLDVARANARRELDLMKRDDANLWRGWYRRHGGEIEFLGDTFGSGDATSAVLLLLFVGLMWTMAKPVRRVAVKPRRQNGGESNGLESKSAET
jgi:hypothetical protein